MIPESFIQELLNRVDVIDVIDKSVPLKKAGSNYVALLSFSSREVPFIYGKSFKTVLPLLWLWRTWLSFKFLNRISRHELRGCGRRPRESVGLAVPQDSQRISPEVKEKNLALGEALELASQYYQSALKKSERAIEYLKKRGLTGQIAKTFQLGYAPEGWQNLESVFKKYDDEALNIAGLVLKNDQGKRYDRFRDRIMFLFII
jgi:DNA primase